MGVDIRRPIRRTHVHVVITPLLKVGSYILAVTAVVGEVRLGCDITGLHNFPTGIVPDVDWIQFGSGAIGSEIPWRFCACQA